MTAPTLFAQGSVTNPSSGNLTVTLPSHQADDIIVVTYGYYGNNDAGPAVGGAVAAPAGWTKFGGTQVLVSGTVRTEYALFWKRATSSSETITIDRPTGDVLWDAGADTSFCGRGYTIRGCETSGNPYDDAQASAAQTVANGTFSAVTVSAAERLVMQFYIIAAGTTVPTAATGWTFGTASTTTAGLDAGTQTFRKDNVSASTSSAAATVVDPSVADAYYVLFGVSFKPPGAAPVTAVMAGAWGALAGSATSGVTHDATASGAWGALASSVTGSVTHAATATGAWGSLTGSATAGTGQQVTATMAGSWGGLGSTNAATVSHGATLAGAWGALTGAMAASVPGSVSATLAGSWGGLTSAISAVEVWRTFADGVSASTGATVTGLQTGVPYYFRVAAVNSVGQGNWSNVAGPYTPTGLVTFAGAWGGLTASAAATPNHPATLVGNWGALAASATATTNSNAALSGAWGALVGSATATPAHPATLSGVWGSLAATAASTVSRSATLAGSWGGLTGAVAATVTPSVVMAGAWGGLSATATAGTTHPSTLSGTWGALVGSMMVGWPRPRARSEVGPRYAYDTIDTTTTSLPPGVYSRIRFDNPVNIHSTGAYEFYDCQIYPTTPSGIVSGHTVYMRNCITGGYADNGGYTGYTLEWCHVEFDGIVAWRPTGSPNYDISTPTPATIRSSIVIAEGPLPDGPHRDAMQCIGGNGYEFEGVWFYTEAEFETGGSSSVTAPVNILASNSTFRSCGMGADGSAAFMVYSDGPNIQYIDCVVGVVEAPDSTRALVESDFYPGTNTGYRAILNGSVVYSTDVSAVLAGAWGALTGSAAASVTQPGAVMTGAWGGLVGAAASVVTRGAVFIAAWGNLSGNAASIEVWRTSPDGVSPSTGAVVIGLINNQAYYFRVAAVNSVGQGDWSNVAGPYTPVGTVAFAGSWGGLVAAAASTISHPATLAGAWGGLVGAASATTNNNALLVGAWGGLSGSASAAVTHPATAAGPWGGLAASAAATTNRSATMSSAWGGLSGAATASTTSGALMAGAWGALAASASASVDHPVTAQGTWGGLSGSAVASTAGGALLAGAWGGLNGAAVAGVAHDAVASAGWGALNGAAVAVPVRSATAQAIWGGLGAAANATVVRSATANGAWGALSATAAAAPDRAATATGAWGGLTGASTAGVEHVATATASWSGLTATGQALVTHPATAAGSWGGWTGAATGLVTVLPTAAGAWGRLVGTMIVDAPLMGGTATGSVRVVNMATGGVRVAFVATGEVRVLYFADGQAVLI